MTTQAERLKRFITAGQILAGDEPGWPARLARRLDMNRGYVASVVAGKRPVNDEIERRLSAAIGTWWEQVRDDAQTIMRIRIELDVELSRQSKGDSDA